MNKTILTAAVLAGVLTGTASAATTNLKPITKTIDVAGTATTITAYPAVSITGVEGSVKIGLSATVDAGEIPAAVAAMTNRKWADSECGQRIDTFDTTLKPHEDGRLHIGISARVEQWACVRGPKIYCEPTWIKLPWPFKGKTKGIPNCRTEHGNLVKTKLVSQSIRVEALARPVIRNGVVSADVQVTRAMPGGLAKTIVKAFGLHGKLKELVQSKLNAKLGEHQHRLPAELDAYNVSITRAAFVALSGGRLGLQLEASGSATQAQIATLLDEQIEKLH